MSANYRLHVVTSLLILGLLALAGYSEAQNSLAEMSDWEVYDHPLFAKNRRSDWHIDQGAIGNNADMPKLSTLPGVDNFGSLLVSRNSYGDGVFRFQVKCGDFRATYGVVLRLQDWQNYWRLEFNSLCSQLIRVKEGKMELCSLPDNFCYVPGGRTTWVDIVCQGYDFDILIDGVQRLHFREESWKSGRLGIFTSGNAQGVVWQTVQFFTGAAPQLELVVSAVKKPYAYWCTGNEARIAWETNIPGRESWIEYAPLQGNMQKTVATTRVCVHSGVLAELKAGSIYNYTCYTDGVSMGSGQLRADPGPGQPFRFGLIGDNRSNPGKFKKLNDLLAVQMPDLVLNVGDIVEKGSRSDWDAEFFTPGRELFAQAPCLVAIGNHEEKSKYFSYYLPYPSPVANGHHYAFRYGGVAFLAFDDYYEPRSEQLAWLEKCLASPQFQEADWRVVFCHQPAYSVGWPEYPGDEWKRGQFLDLLEKYRVEFFFNGHTHSYERGLWRGTHHILSGGGGCGNETFGRCWPHVQVFKVTYQYCWFAVTPERIDMICQEIDGTILDRLVVKKGRPAALDATPAMVGLPARSQTSKEVVITVSTVELGRQNLRYNVRYDPRVDSYTWSRPQPANAPFEIILSRDAALPYTITVTAMDEDGRTSKPFYYKVE